MSIKPHKKVYWRNEIIKRGNFEQILDVLEACRKTPIPTQIASKAKINQSVMKKKFLDILQQCGYVEVFQRKPKTSPCIRKNIYNRVEWHLTEKGRSFIKTLAPLLELGQKLDEIREK